MFGNIFLVDLLSKAELKRHNIPTMIINIPLEERIEVPLTVATQRTCVPLCSGVTVMDKVLILVPLSMGNLNEGFKSVKVTKSDPFISQSLTLAPDSRRHLKVASVSIGYIKVVFTGYSANTT